MNQTSYKPEHIRPVRRDDVAALRNLIDATGLFPGEMLNGMVEPFLAGETNGDIWLTYDDGAPVAVAYHAPERMTSGTVNLLLIAVHPARQGKGVGTALMMHVETELVHSGQRVLLVETSSLPTFARTRQFYAGLGYDEEARIREFYSAGEDKIIFRKALQPGHS